MAAAIMYVTQAGGGVSQDGTDWDNAFSLTEWQNDVENNMEAGDIYYVAGGTYTLGGAWNTALSGDVNHFNMVHVIGVKSGTTAEPPTTADWAYLDDRPLIAAGANTFTWEDDTIFRNLRVTTTAPEGFAVDDWCQFYNCKSTNSSGVGGRAAFFTSLLCFAINCEGISTLGLSFQFSAFGNRAVNCYAHDSNKGILIQSNYGTYVGNIVANNTAVGIHLATAGAGFSGTVVHNNTIYNSTKGLLLNYAYNAIFYNNIIANNSMSGIEMSTENFSNYRDYNCSFGNGDDFVRATAGANSITTDPLFMDAANGDFRLKANSPCINTGMPSLGNVATFNEAAQIGNRTTMGAWHRKSLLGVR